MTYTALKHGMRWDFLAKHFDLKGVRSERLMQEFLKNISDFETKELLIIVQRARERSEYTTERTHSGTLCLLKLGYPTKMTDKCVSRWK